MQIFGETSRAHRAATLARVSYVAQDHPLYQDFSVRDMLHLGRAMNPAWDQALAERRLGDLGIGVKRKVKGLSGGQRPALHPGDPGRPALPGAGAPGLAETGTCQNAIGTFLDNWGFTYNQALIALLIIPGLIGVVIGAPLLGRELEQGTWRMAWSQTVPRTRWLVTKLMLVTGGLVILGTAMTVLLRPRSPSTCRPALTSCSGRTPRR